MLDRAICGGRTGADQAGWRAAKALGLATGGYPERTRAHVRDSDATLWLGDPRRIAMATPTAEKPRWPLLLVRVPRAWAGLLERVGEGTVLRP